MKEYTYCPLCRSDLKRKMHDGTTRLICDSCGYIHYTNPLPSVAALVLDQQGHILLVKRGESPKKGSWALPTGFMEQNETGQSAVIRELKEETGLDGEAKHLINVYTEQTRKYGSVILIGYKITSVTGRLKAGSDTTAVKYFPKNALPAIPFKSHQQLIDDVFNDNNCPLIEVLKSKITEARITDTQLHYRGSMGIDRKIMKAANIFPGEKVHVLNYNNGVRLETYTIAEKAGSKKFILYGPASRKGNIGDKLCILAYQFIDMNKASVMQPKIIVLDERNNIKRKHT